MSAAVSRSAILRDAPSPIDADFIRRLREQRDLHKGEAAFHLAEAEKHGAADEALASMIQAAEKIVAIMLPASAEGADAPAAAPQERANIGGPTWAQPPAAEIAATATPLIHTPLPASHVPEDRPSDNLMGNSGADGGGNSWRTRFLRSGT